MGAVKRFTASGFAAVLAVAVGFALAFAVGVGVGAGAPGQAYAAEGSSLAISQAAFFGGSGFDGMTSQATGDTGKAAGFEYEEVDGGVVITACTLTKKKVTIPTTLKGKPVVGVRSWGDKNKATTIVVPEGVSNLFVGFWEGDDVVNPFWQDNKLKKFVVAKGNPSYKAVDGVLYSKNGKTLYSYPAGKRTKSYVMPDKVTKLTQSCFQGAKMQVLTVGKNYKNKNFDTEYRQFMNPLAGCSALKSIKVAKGNPSYKAVDGVLYSMDGTVLYAYPNGRTNATFVMPTSVTKLAMASCAGARFQNVTLSRNLLVVGASSMSSCPNLRTLVIPDKVTTVGTYAFEFCPKLASLTYGANVTSLGGIALQGCTNLKKVVVKSTKLERMKSMAAFVSTPVTQITVDMGNAAKNEAYAKKYNETTEMNGKEFSAYLGNNNGKPVVAVPA